VAAIDVANGLAAGNPGSGPIAIRDDEWAPGIVGLVAGRLADSLARPVAVAARVGEELRGSVRSPLDFHVAAALEACAGLLSKRGGHAGAGGFSLPAERWNAFVAAWTQLPRPYPPDPSRIAERAGLAVDLVLPATHLGWTLADEIDRLAPFGPGHVEPILAITGLQVVEARRVGGAGEHLMIRLRRGAETFDAIAFGTPLDRPTPEPETLLDLVGTLERDEFQGEPRLRLRTLDYADAASSPLAARRLATTATVAIAVDPVAVG